MIRLINWSFLDEENEDFTPQAIFCRALGFFTFKYTSGCDDFDVYEGALFCLRNEFRFTLKHYAGHPPLTVTLYLEEKLTDLADIDDALRKVVEGFELPNTAIGWKRGDDIKSGFISERRDRLLEREARILVLKIAAMQPNYEATTTFIKSQVPKFRPLSEADLEPSPSRKKEKKWQQIVGNVKSHHQQPSSIFSMGYAKLTKNGIKVTKSGLHYLENLGFLASYNQV